MPAASTDRLHKGASHGFGTLLVDAKRAGGTVKLLLYLYIAQMLLGLSIGFLIPILRYLDLI